MADIIVSVAAKISEYLVAFVGHQFGYCLHHDRVFENLGTEVRRLEGKKNDVERCVNEASMRGEVIKPEVENGLSIVTGTIVEANNFLQNHAPVNRECFYSWSRYKLSKEAKMKMENLIRIRGEGGFDGFSYPSPLRDMGSMSNGNFVDFKSRTSAFNEVMEALKDDIVNIIGIYGMGGVGKTMLVKEIGKQVERDGHFDKVLMAVVSQTPDIKVIQDYIAEMLGLKFTETSDPGRADRLSKALEQLLKEKRILVILDDVWERLELLDVGIPSRGSHMNLKLVLTTRREQVCQVMECQRWIKLNVLSEQESWNLFIKNVGEIVESPNLNDVARKVANECDGLPIAIVTVGRALRNKGNLHEWEQALHELRNATPINVEDVDKKVYACLKLSYDYLKIKESKQIFLFCCLFPEDHHINIEILVYYAMGRGLFQHVTNNIEEARISVHGIINNLVSSSLLLEIEEVEERRYIKMHDVVRNVAILIASTDENDMFMIKASAGLKHWPNVVCENFSVISLMHNEIKELPVGLKCPKLKILSLRGNSKLMEFPDRFFEGMTSLEVLDLSLIRSTEPMRLPKSIQFLKSLRIFLARKRSISDISTLGELKSLEILDLDSSRIKELPKEIRQLNNLRLLNLKHCYWHIKVSSGAISCLSRLEELYIDWNGRLDEEIADWFDQLKILSCLKILYVRIVNAGEIGLSYIRFHLSKLQVSLGKLESTCTTLPLGVETPLVDGINALLEETKFLHIKHSKFLRNLLFHLNRTSIVLQSLETLHLENCSGIEYLINVVELTGTSQLSLCPSLREIHMECMDDLKLIWCGPLLATTYFRKLRILKVSGCQKLLNVVSSNLLKMLPHLEELVVNECDALEEIFDLNDNEHICAQEGYVLPLSHLTTLYLSHLPRLEIIWKCPTQLSCLHSLRNVKLEHCRQLRYLF